MTRGPRGGAMGTGVRISGYDALTGDRDPIDRGR
jgi:hypothetical protein